MGATGLHESDVLSEAISFPPDGELWFSSLSADPAAPSTIVINRRIELAALDISMIVVPGEVLSAYRIDDGMVVTGFPNVIIH